MKKTYVEKLADSLHSKERIFDKIKQREEMIKDLQKALAKEKNEKDCLTLELNNIKNSRSYKALAKIHNMFK